MSKNKQTKRGRKQMLLAFIIIIGIVVGVAWNIRQEGGWGGGKYDSHNNSTWNRQQVNKTNNNTPFSETKNTMVTPMEEVEPDHDVVTVEKEVELIAKPDLSRADLEDASKSSAMSYYTGVAWEEMIQEPDTPWCTQFRLEEYADYGRMRIKEGAFDAPFGMQAVLEKKANEISQYIAEVIPKIQKPFDMSVKYPIINDGKMERGLIKFNGWKLDHFERLYIFNGGNPASSYNIIRAWDYCLGEDGKLYMVYSVSGKYNDNRHVTDLKYWIYDLLPYDAMFLENKNQNMVVSVSHGLLYTLDAIPKERADNVIVDRGNEKEKDIFNFPLQLKDYGYPETGEGILARINALL